MNIPIWYHASLVRTAPIQTAFDSDKKKQQQQKVPCHSFPPRSDKRYYNQILLASEQHCIKTEVFSQEKRKYLPHQLTTNPEQIILRCVPRANGWVMTGVSIKQSNGFPTIYYIGIEQISGIRGQFPMRTITK